MVFLASKEDAVIDIIDTEDKEMKLGNLVSIDIVFTFMDKQQSVVPLTPFQGAFLVQMMGFVMDKERNGLAHYTDADLNQLYKLLSPEEFDELVKKESLFMTNP